MIGAGFPQYLRIAGADNARLISVQAMNRAIAMYWQAAAAQTYT
jgi:hypothetical protein